VALVVAYLGRAASLRTVTAARVNLDRALVVAARAGGTAGLLVQSLSGLSLGLLGAVFFALRGGFGAPLGVARELGLRATLVLPTLALGAAGAALAWQRTGSVYHAAGDLGSDLGGELRGGLPHDDARNPALVADLVGDHVGLGVGRAVDLFVTATVANVASCIAGAAILAANGHADGVLSLVALPFVVQGFGIIASAFGLMVVRTEDDQRPITALWRGQATTVVVLLAGLVGATIWLVRDHWWRHVLAGSMGLAAALAVGHSLRYLMVRRFQPLRDLVEAQRIAEATSVVQGVGAGLERTLFPPLVLGVALTVSWSLGAATGVQGEGVVTLMTALMAMLALTPYLLAICTLGTVADNARGVLGLMPGSPAEEVNRRTAALDEAAWLGGNVAQSSLGVVGATAALLTAAILPVVAGGMVGPWVAPQLELSQPILAWSGVCGVTLVLGCAGAATRASARAVRMVLLEVDRQLRKFPRERGGNAVPRDFTPSYRVPIELSSRFASSGLTPVLGAALLLPGLVGFGLASLPRDAGSALGRSGLVVFVAAASLAGLCLAWALEGARAALGTARRLHRPQPGTPSLSAVLTGDAIADVLGNVAAPAAQLVAKTVAVAALVVAPFIH
jgi:K(+)-stimulated pyrophosphate-energized sodium pump